MKKIALTLFYLMVMGCELRAQSPNLNTNADVKIYEALFEGLKFRKSKPLHYKTSLQTLRRVDFKNLTIKKWLGTDSVRNWKSFFESININGLGDMQLQSAIANHNFTNSKEVGFRSEGFIELSPIVYSTDKQLALCGVFDYDNSEASSETLYLLQYKNGKWNIVRFLMLTIS